MNKLRRGALLALPASILLAACGQDATTTAADAGRRGEGAVPRLRELEKQVHGFETGSQLSARRLVVFFDAQCPHCGRLWDAVKPYGDRLRVTWVPVGLLSRASMAQGAVILAAQDPVAKMDENEAARNSGGISVGFSLPEAQEGFMKANTKLFEGLGAGGVPFIVGEHATTGAVVTLAGALPVAQIAQSMGWGEL